MKTPHESFMEANCIQESDLNSSEGLKNIMVQVRANMSKDLAEIVPRPANNLLLMYLCWWINDHRVITPEEFNRLSTILNAARARLEAAMKNPKCAEEDRFISTVTNCTRTR